MLSSGGFGGAVRMNIHGDCDYVLVVRHKNPDAINDSICCRLHVGVAKLRKVQLHAIWSDLVQRLPIRV